MTILVANPKRKQDWQLKFVDLKKKVLTFFLFKQKNQIFSENLMRKKYGAG